MASSLKIVRRTINVQPQSASVVPNPRAPVVQLHDSDEVLVMVPKAFNLTDDDHTPHKYPVGTYMMPREHAQHWYARANGVQLANTRNPALA